MQQGQLDEALHRRLPITGPQGVGDLVILHHIGEAVGAQQPASPRHFGQLHHVGADGVLGAHGPGDDVAVGMNPRLGRGDGPGAHHITHHRMIHADLAQLAVLKHIGAAVPHVAQQQIIPIVPQGGHGGAHAGILAVRKAFFVHGVIGPAEPAGELVHAGFLAGQGVPQDGGGHEAGHLARLMTAHAVRQDIQAVLLVGQHGVLVLLPHKAHMGSEVCFHCSSK